MQEPVDGELEALLEYIHERRNFDFRGYKRASLGRRIQKRMQAIGVEGYKSYQEVLEANPGEFAELFNTILINVTGLMRDREAWAGLIETAIPAIAQSTAPDDPIRVWSAGCASGEEAYSLAIVFAEAVGHDRFRQAVEIHPLHPNGAYALGIALLELERRREAEPWLRRAAEVAGPGPRRDEILRLVESLRAPKPSPSHAVVTVPPPAAAVPLG